MIELSAISGPARPQMAAVKAEMERGLSGASHPHQRETGIYTRFDGFKRRCTGGSWRKAPRLLRADRSVKPELSFIPSGNGGKYFSDYWESGFLFVFAYKSSRPQP